MKVLRHQQASQLNSRRMNVPQASDRRGAALVEFAVMAPVILCLILGVVEMGNALDVSNKLTSAIREGGRLAATDWTDVVADGQSPNDKVITDIRNFLQASKIPASKVTLSITHAEGSSQGRQFDLADKNNMNKLFQISASINYADASAIPSQIMNGQKLVASITLRAGRIQLTSN